MCNVKRVACSDKPKELSSNSVVPLNFTVFLIIVLVFQPATPGSATVSKQSPMNTLAATLPNNYQA